MSVREAAETAAPGGPCPEAFAIGLCENTDPMQPFPASRNGLSRLGLVLSPPPQMVPNLFDGFCSRVLITNSRDQVKSL